MYAPLTGSVNHGDVDYRMWRFFMNTRAICGHDVVNACAYAQAIKEQRYQTVATERACMRFTIAPIYSAMPASCAFGTNVKPLNSPSGPR